MSKAGKRGWATALAFGLSVGGVQAQGFQGGLGKSNGTLTAEQETPWKPGSSKKFKGGLGKQAKQSAQQSQGTTYAAGLQLPKLSAKVGPRALYVWDNTIPGDVPATDALIDFCEMRFISSVFIECSPIGYGFAGAFANYHDFITALNAEGIEVYALNGYGWFTVSPTAGIPGQPTGWTEGWDIYENVATSGLGFKGIVDDSAPYGVVYTSNGVTVDRFWDDTAVAAQDYLDYLRGIDARIGGLEFIATIPFWYDQDPSLQLKLDGSKKARSLNVYVQDIVDTANVLAYRDEAFGSLGLLACIAGEIKEGDVLVGVETQDLGPSLTGSTFFEESLVTMENELLSTWLPYRRKKRFEGFSIHNYGAYRDKQ